VLEGANLENKFIHSRSHLPKINKLKAWRTRIEKNGSDSQDDLERTSLKELAESIQVDTPAPLYKNQYSIGQKWIPHHKKGKNYFVQKMKHRYGTGRHY
jgi:hypothetical protein